MSEESASGIVPTSTGTGFLKWADNNPLFAYWIPTVIYAAAIFVLSSFSRPPQPPGTEEITFFSEIVHFAEYAILGVLVYLSLNAFYQNGSRPRIAAVAFLVCAIYAASDEIHQSFVPGRASTFEDFIVDCIGAALAITACTILTRQSAKQTKRVKLR